jgi:hypothetical protein
MHYRDPNRPTPGASHEDSERGARKLQDRVGHAAKDGYSLHYRRPRVRHSTETVEPDRADRIEGMSGKYPMTGSY